MLQLTKPLFDLMSFGRYSRAVALMNEFAPVDPGIPLGRFGGAGDGGYLIPQDIDGIKAVFSPGVATVADFELAFAERGVPCFMADRTVDGPPIPHPCFHFTKRHLGPSSTKDTISLEEWVRTSAPAEGDLLLQMDIEGAEYEVLDATPPELLSRFRIIAIEAHDLHRIRTARMLATVQTTFSRLLRTHMVVHAHPNNCRKPRRWYDLNIHPVVEFTLLRKDRARQHSAGSALPHPLDRPNVPGTPEYPLDLRWRGFREGSR